MNILKEILSLRQRVQSLEADLQGMVAGQRMPGPVSAAAVPPSPQHGNRVGFPINGEEVLVILRGGEGFLVEGQETADAGRIVEAFARWVRTRLVNVDPGPPPGFGTPEGSA